MGEGRVITGCNQASGNTGEERERREEISPDVPSPPVPQGVLAPPRPPPRADGKGGPWTAFLRLRRMMDVGRCSQVVHTGCEPPVPRGGSFEQNKLILARGSRADSDHSDHHHHVI
ncbi:unnamed protein product [Lota lota]